MSDFDVSEAVGELENMVNAAWDAGYAKGVDWAKKCGGGIDAMTDTELAEHGLVRLPVDADGVPIHVGDVLEWDNGTFTVHELKVTEDGWTTWDEQHGYTVHVDVCHHHAPTVEDVLREFAEKVIDSQIPSVHPTYEEAITEYAAKLRLADDGKEQ